MPADHQCLDARRPQAALHLVGSPTPSISQKRPSSTHLQASAAIKQQELEAVQAEQAAHSSAVERQRAQAECRVAESQAACEEAQAQLMEAREHQQELSRQLYVAEQAEQQLRAKVGGLSSGMAGPAGKEGTCCLSKC